MYRLWLIGHAITCYNGGLADPPMELAYGWAIENSWCYYLPMPIYDELRWAPLKNTIWSSLQLSWDVFMGIWNININDGMSPGNKSTGRSFSTVVMINFAFLPHK